MDTDVDRELDNTLGLEGCDQWHKFHLEASHQCCTTRFDTAVKLFNVFINDLGDGMNCTLIRFAENADLRRVAGTPGRYADIQSGLDRLENWAPGNRLKFNTIKYPVLNLNKNLFPSTGVFVKSLEQHKGDINVFIFAVSATSVQ